jgi:alpha-amylase/alpha-mannosidase (GH57 family)
MHKPDYRDHCNGEHQQPWVYLHAIKDYIDMVAHLEKNPAARAVVNFTPILLEQIDDYNQQIQSYLNNSCALSDPLLSALAEPTLPSDIKKQRSIIKACLQVNKVHSIQRFSSYKRLANMAEWITQHPDEVHYLNNQYLADLLVWFHLAWLGETVRRDNPVVQELVTKGSGFIFGDRHKLLIIIGQLLSNLIERYRRLAMQGRIELSMTPYAHPILPLLLDMTSARDALPNVNLPLLEKYPGGEQRARWHIEKGIETFEHYFGFKPQGCLPAEGGLCVKTLALLDEYNFNWTASGDNVLSNRLQNNSSEKKSPKENTHKVLKVKLNYLYNSYQLDKHAIHCFFRDDEMSDLIDFTYSDWDADDAVSNFIHDLEKIASHPSINEYSVISIILDGENPWEYYPQNAFYFLEGLYKCLSKNPRLNLTTFSAYLESLKKNHSDDSHKDNHSSNQLTTIAAGSWVYGSFSAWVGDEKKNHAWNLLIDAKLCFDRVISGGKLSNMQVEKARRQLAICEGSDWFWWFGDYNPADTVSKYEHLYQLHLSNLYQLLHEPPPAYLAQVFTHGGGSPAKGSVM